MIPTMTLSLIVPSVSWLENKKPDGEEVMFSFGSPAICFKIRGFPSPSLGGFGISGVTRFCFFDSYQIEKPPNKSGLPVLVVETVLATR
jgi:hypothetical protein